MTRHALIPTEPLGDRPAVFDVFGDVWQRYGPPGSDSWWCAHPNGAIRGLSWPALHDLSGGEVYTIDRPDLPDLAYTTDSIPVISG